MPPPGDPRHHHRPPGRDFDDDGDEPSSNLWVGNLPPDTAEAELTALFSKHGPLDSVTTYATRNYAFVHFKRPGDAAAAKAALQGAPVRGHHIKIEFARPNCITEILDDEALVSHDHVPYSVPGVTDDPGFGSSTQNKNSAKFETGSDLDS